jgi:hypothetical protein
VDRSPGTQPTSMPELTCSKSKLSCLLVSVSSYGDHIATDTRFSVVQDSYTDGGGNHDGSPLAPPIIIPPNAEAGGRSTNGKLWIENIADDIGAKIMDYAVSCLRLQLVEPGNKQFVSGRLPVQ